MVKQCFAFLVVAAALACVLPASAQQKKRVSPHETISATISGDPITITYGRPYSKDPKSGQVRKIWGGLVPYGKAWRAGADEATTLTTEQPLMVGEALIPAGKYTLYTLPTDSGPTKLAFGKKTGQWGIPVDEKNDLARVDMKKETLPKTVDQFTMAIEKTTSGGGVIKMMWEDTEYSVPFTVAKK